MAPVADRTETTLPIQDDTLNVSRPRGEEAASSPLVSQAVERARAGDRDALRFLYARYADDVCGYVYAIVSDHHEARTVTRRVFADLRRLIDRHDERDTPFPIWIRQIARAAAAEHAHR
jgi:RNA polymerase sigma-70 factor (ECF subfamily)